MRDLFLRLREAARRRGLCGRFSLVLERSFFTLSKRKGTQGRGRTKVFSGAVRDTVLVTPGRRVVIAFNANNPGLWAFHCHLPRLGYVAHGGVAGLGALQASATSWRTSSRPIPEPPPVTTAIGR
jgi:Multicopper oxidase